MRVFLKTTQDASIYENVPNFNTGLDEVLELGKSIDALSPTQTTAAAGTIRSLLHFDVDDTANYPDTAKYYLNLYIADAKYINRYQNIEIAPVTTPWQEGSGYIYQDRRNVSDGVTWYSASRTDKWTTDGGDYSTTLTSSFEFKNIPFTSNLRVDVTNIVAPVVAGTNIVPWNGLIVKLPNVDEQDDTNVGNVKVFSGNTHTVFEPTLEIVWNDQVFITGSLKKLPSTNITISPKNIREAYTQGEIDKIYLIVRDKYPDKRFDATQRYRNQYYLPSESYFRVRDQAADVEIHRFDQYSAINCDASGSYILLDTTGLNVNRYYDLELKVKSDELVFFPEFKYTFKIDNND